MMRTCKKCCQEKDIESFVKSKVCRYGRAYTCNDCHNAKGYAWREQNPSKAKEIARRATKKRDPVRKKFNESKPEQKMKAAGRGRAYRKRYPERIKAHNDKTNGTMKLFRIEKTLGYFDYD
jgi:superfamily II helicase